MRTIGGRFAATTDGSFGGRRRPSRGRLSRARNARPHCTHRGGGRTNGALPCTSPSFCRLHGPKTITRRFPKFILQPCNKQKNISKWHIYEYLLPLAPRLSSLKLSLTVLHKVIFSSLRFSVFIFLSLSRFSTILLHTFLCRRHTRNIY